MVAEVAPEQLEQDSESNLSSQSAGAALDLIFIDDSVADRDRLTQELEQQTNVEIVLLDSEESGIAQITQSLAEYSNVGSLQLISDSPADQLKLGSDELSEQALFAHAGEISRWGTALNADSEIVLHGSQRAATNVDQVLDNISNLTGAEAIESVIPESPTATATHLVLVDSRIENYEQLLEGLVSDTPVEYEVVVLDDQSDGIQQITTLLAGNQSFGAIHVVSHGSAGSLQLGNTTLNANNLSAYQAQISTWSQSLSEDADILLYGCDVAGSIEGQWLVNQIGHWAGADIAASDDLTGHDSFGGDWEFEYVVGAVETDLAFSLDVQQAWYGTLQTVTVTTVDDVVNGDTSSINNLVANDGGDGISLREAIIAANGTAFGDTVVLGSGTYALSLTGGGELLGDLDILHDTEIIGAANGTTIVDATALNDRAFHVNSNTATFRNLTITGGTTAELAGGGGILGAGATDIILENVKMTNNSATSGGAVRSSGSFTAINSTFSENTSTGSGGALSLSASSSFQTVTIAGNVAGADGGGVYISNGNHDFDNVTLSGNESSNGGGMQIASGNVNLNHVTITENSAATAGGGIYHSSGTTTVSNSIIAGNLASSGIEVSGTISSIGNNIIGNDLNDSIGGAGYHLDDLLDQTGLTLGALADNNGAVQTHELLAGSVGIDGGSGSQALDGRGFFRNDGTADIGAYERGATPNLEQDLVAHFEFEEGGGSDAEDSAHGNTGNIVNGGNWTTNSAVGGLALDLSNDAEGNNSYIHVPDNPLYDFGTGEFSISLWYNMSTPTETVRLIGNIDPGMGGTGFALRAQANGDFSFERSDGIITFYDYSSGVVMDGEWHHLTVTVETDGAVEFFVDGIPTTSSFTTSVVNVNSSDPLTIGAVDAVTGDFEGALDDVRMFSRALTRTEASQLAAGAQSQGSNSAPTFQMLDDVVAYTEGNSNSVPLDIDVQIFDQQLSFEDDFGGASLRFERVGGGNPDDNFNRVSGGNLAFVSGSRFELSGVQKGSYSFGGGILNLTFDPGTTNADVNEIMRSIGYRNFTDDPPASVDIQWTFSDGNTGNQGSGGVLTTTGTSTVNITPVNDLASTDLDANDDSGATNADYKTTFNGSPVRIADVDALLIDPDSSAIFRMDVKIANLLDGADESLSVDTSAYQNINANYNSTFGSLVISGSGTLAEYEAILKSIEYNNVSASPDTNSRNISVEVTDGGGFGPISYSTIQFALTDLSSGIELNTDGGNDSFLQATDGDALLGNATEVTVEFSVKLENPPLQAPHLISYRTAGQDFEFRVYLNTSDGLMLSVGGNSVLGGNASQLRDGEQHHVAVSWDSESGHTTFYLDGELLGTNTVSEGHTIDTGGTLVVGQGQAGFAAQAVHGTLYDVRIWDEVRSEAEIALNYQHKIDDGNLPSGLIANWQMDGLTPAHQINDIVSGNNLNIGHVGETRIDSWTNQSGGVTATGNTLTFVDDGIPDGWNSQINSDNVSTLGYSDDYTILFTLDNTTNFAWTVGLGTTELDSEFSDPEYAIYVDYLGDPNDVEIMHNGISAGTYDINFFPGGEFGFYINGTTLEYQYDGVTFATDTIAAGTDWYVDTSFFGRTSDSTYNDQDDYSLSNFHIVAGNGTPASGFSESNPVYDLNVDENSANGTSVGVVVPSTVNIPNDVVLDGRFTDQSIVGAFQTFTSPTTFGKWDVVNNQAVVYNDVNQFAFTPLEGRGIELGNAAGPGTIQQSLNTVTGQTYQVTFALAGDFSQGETTKDLRVTTGSTWRDFSIVESTGWSQQTPLWEHRTITFTATGPTTTLSFESLDLTGTGHSVIGDVQVIEVPAAINTILNSDPSLTYDAAAGKFYKLVASSSIWTTAQSNANADLLNGVAGNLVTIRSASENSTIRNLLQTNSITGAWIGSTDESSEGIWTWQDGSGDTFYSSGAAVPGQFSGFQGVEPSGGATENYAEMDASTGGWNDLNTASTRASVVEWDASEVLSNYTFGLTNDANGRFAIDSNTGEITVLDSSQLNHEADATHDVTVKVTDAAGNTFDEVMTISVNDVNDSPVITGQDLTFGSVEQTETDPSGITVADLLASGSGDAITDEDSGAVDGIAIVAANNVNGSWQYSLDGGTIWNGMPSTSTSSALLLDASAMIRFVPDGSFTGTESMAFFAWDQTDGRSSGDSGVDTIAERLVDGGSISSTADIGEIEVTQSNLAPDSIDSTNNGNEDSASIAVSISGSDSDGSISGYNILSLPTNGTLYLDAALTNTVSLGVMSTSLTSVPLYFVPTPDFNGTITFDFAAIDNEGIQDASPGTTTIQVIAVNDAPLVTAPGNTFSFTEQGSVNIHGTGLFAVADVDDNGGEFTATFSVGEGRLLVSAGDSGVTVVSGERFTSGNSTDTVTFSGTKTQLNSLLSGSSTGSIVYWNDQTAASDVPSSSTTITLTVNDQGNTGNDPGVSADGSSEENSATQTINTVSVNDAPVFLGEELISNGGFSDGLTDWNTTGQTSLSANQARFGSGNLEGPHTLSQTIITTAGETYVLEFDYRDDTTTWNQQLQVTVAGNSNLLTTEQILSDVGDATLVRYRYTFIADSANATVTFTDTSDNVDSQSAESGGVDGYLTNVSVRQASGVLGSASFTEGGPAVTLDSGLEVFDAELQDLDDFDRVTLTLQRSGGANVEDVFSATGNLSFNGTTTGSIELAPAGVVGTYSNTGGTLTLSFAAGTEAKFHEVIQSIQYSNTSGSPPASVQIEWTIDDGNTGAQGIGGALQSTASTLVSITSVNNAPVLDNSGSMTLSPIWEDSSENAGNTVADIIASAGGDRITDVDAGAVEGIAVYFTDSTNGRWEYSVDGGNTWLDLDSASSTQARLLNPASLIRFEPVADFNGTATMSFRAWDQTNGNNGDSIVMATAGSTLSVGLETARITVSPVNDVPRFIGLDANPAFIEDGLSVVLDDDAQIFDADLSGFDNFDRSTIYVGRTGGANTDDVFTNTGLLGSLTEGGNAVYNGTIVGTVNQNSGGELIIQFNGSATNAIVNSVMQTITYSNSNDTPPSSVDLTWTFNDNNDGSQGSGSAEFISQQLTIDITATNDSPSVVHYGGIVNEGEYVTLTPDMIQASDVDDAAGNLTYTISNIANGQFEVSGSPGTPITNFTQAQIDAGQIVFLHDGSETTIASFDFSLADGGEDGAAPATGTFYFTVAPDNDAPESVSTVNDGTEDNVLSITLTGSDIDGSVDGFRIINLPANGLLYTDAALTNQVVSNAVLNAGGGGSISLWFEPNANWNGTTSFNFSAIDDQGLQDPTPGSVTINISPAPDAPELVNLDGDVVNFGAGDPAKLLDIGLNALVTDADSTDFDGGNLMVSIVNADPSEDVLSVISTGTGPGQISVTGSEVYYEGVLIGSTADFLDPMTGELGLGVSFNQNAGKPAVTALLKSIAYNNIDIVNPTTTSRTVEFVLQDGDGGSSSVSTVTVNVAANVAPESNETLFLGDEDDAYVAISIGGSDFDGTVSGYRVISLPTNGTLYFDAGLTNPVSTGLFNTSLSSVALFYVPNPNYNGIDSFEFATIDNLGLEDATPGSTSISLTPSNDAPTSSLVVLTSIAEDSGARTITQSDLLTNAGDIDGDGLTATNLNVTSGSGILIDNGDGTWDYTPDLNDDTTVSFGYNISDNTTSIAGSAILDITPVNDSPTTTAVVLSPLAEDSGTRVVTQANLIENAIDIDGDMLTVTGLVGTSSNGTLTDNGNGTWSYTPNTDFNGTDSFIFEISDGKGGVVVGNASIDVTPVNDSPQLNLENELAGIDENTVLASPTKVADISVSDDETGINELSLTGSDAHRFELIGTELYVLANSSWDFETQSNYEVTIRIDDSTLGTSWEDSIEISFKVYDVNEAPTISLTPVLTSMSRNEDTSVAIEVAKIVVTDDALGTEVLGLSGKSADQFEIIGDRLWLKSGAELLLADAIQEVTVEVRDPAISGPSESTAAFALEIVDVAPPPTNSPSNPTETDSSNDSNDSSSTEDEDDSETTEVVQADLPAVNPSNENTVTTNNSIAKSGTQTETVQQETSTSLAAQVVRAADAETDPTNAMQYGNLDQRIAGSDLELQSFNRVTVTQTPLTLIQFEESAYSSNSQASFQFIAASTSAIATTSLSVGYVVWLLRGGSLFASLLSSLPAWAAFDPLPVLNGFDAEDQESLSDIAGQ
jgi:hypothetical protein